MSESKTHWKKTFNKDYLGEWDLDEGEELKLVISRIEVKQVKSPTGDSDNCNVAFFTNPKIKPMILNVGACKIIQRFSGSKYIQDWGGTAIQVYVQPGVLAFGSTVDALRLREHQPRMEKPALTPDHEKWQGAIGAYADNKDLAVITKYYSLSPAHELLLKNEAAKLEASTSQD